MEMEDLDKWQTFQKLKSKIEAAQYAAAEAAEAAEQASDRANTAVEVCQEAINVLETTDAIGATLLALVNTIELKP